MKSVNGNNKIKNKIIWWTTFFILFSIIGISFFILCLASLFLYKMDISKESEIWYWTLLKIGMFGLAINFVVLGICGFKVDKWKDLYVLNKEQKQKENNKYKRVLEWKNE